MTDDDDNGVSDAEMVEAAEVAGGEDDFFDHEPSRQEKMEVGLTLELQYSAISSLSCSFEIPFSDSYDGKVLLRHWIPTVVLFVLRFT